MADQALPVPVGTGPQGTGPSGLVRVMSNDQMVEAERHKADEEQAQPPISELAAFVRRAWQSARDAKEPYYREMVKSMRQRRGEYDPDKLRQIREQGGSEVFMNLSKTKCKGALSWLKDVLRSEVDTPFSLRPTPNPSLPPVIDQAVTQQIMGEVQYLNEIGAFPSNRQVAHRRNQIADAVRKEVETFAKDASRRMSKKIDDAFREGGWYEAMDQFLDHVTSFKTAFLRGPVFRNRTVLEYEMAPTGTYRAVRRSRIQPEWYAPNPFDVYPSGDSRDVNDGYIIERHEMRRKSLTALKGVEGYSEKAINAVLAEYGRKGLVDWLWEDRERQYIENRDNAWRNSSPDSCIEALEFSGRVQGRMLREWGVKGVDDLLAEYEANVWLIGRYVIRATLNKDPLGRRNYFKASYEELPNAFWGEDIPHTMRDTQAVCNAVARALVNNVAVASGPQAEVFEDRLMAGEDITGIHPWKIWQTKSDPTGGGHRAVNFHQPSLVADALTRIYEYFSRLADNQTGIPSYVYGDADVTGAGRTASGLSMLMSGASKGLKAIVANIDNGIVKPSVERYFQYLMLYDPDPTIKGDLEIVPMGSSTLIAKEQLQIRRTELLQATTNDIDFQIMGPDGRARLLREITKTLDLPDGIIPDPDSLEAEIGRAIDQAAAKQAQGAQQGGPAPVTADGGRPTDGNVFPNEG